LVILCWYAQQTKLHKNTVCITKSIQQCPAYASTMTHHQSSSLVPDPLCGVARDIFYLFSFFLTLFSFQTKLILYLKTLAQLGKELIYNHNSTCSHTILFHNRKNSIHKWATYLQLYATTSYAWLIHRYSSVRDIS